MRWLESKLSESENRIKKWVVPMSGSHDLASGLGIRSGAEVQPTRTFDIQRIVIVSDKDVPKGRGVLGAPPPPLGGYGAPAGRRPAGSPQLRPFALRATGPRGESRWGLRTGFRHQQNIPSPSGGHLERARAPDKEPTGPFGGIGALCQNAKLCQNAFQGTKCARQV